MRRNIRRFLILCLLTVMSFYTVHAQESSCESEVGYYVSEDSIYKLNVQVVGRGVVRDGKQYIRTNLIYETKPGIVKEFILEPADGYRVKQVSYERIHAGLEELSTDSPQRDDAAISAMATMAEDEDVLLAQYTGPLPDMVIDVTDQLQGDRIEIQMESVDTRLIVVYEPIPEDERNQGGTVEHEDSGEHPTDTGNSSTRTGDRDPVNEAAVSKQSGVVDTADHTNTVPYLILMLAALLIMAERKRRLSEEEYKTQEEMKMKKTRVFTATMALTMAAGMFAMPVFAEEGKNDGQGTNPEETIVSYNNATIIEDPSKEPATWGVEVPKAITFTDKISSIRADVKLVNLTADGGDAGYPADEANGVTISVVSKNGYEMRLNDVKEPDPLKYTLGYKKGDAIETAPIAADTSFEIGKLYVGNESIEGIAVKKSNALMTGNHTDRLIYTITTATVKP